MIDEKYEILSLRIKEKLENISVISLTTDVWTDTLNTKAYLGLTGHFVDINCKKLCSVTLGVKELNDRHNADYLGTVIKDVCQQWNIIPDKITVFITDNAANIVKAIVNQYGKHKHLSRFTHTINLIASRPFDEKEGLIELKQIITAVKEIVTFFKHSVIAADDLRKSQEDSLSPLKLIQSVITRWNSTYYQLERFLHLSSKIAPILLKHPKAPTMISATQMEYIKDLIIKLNSIINLLTSGSTNQRSFREKLYYC